MAIIKRDTATLEADSGPQQMVNGLQPRLRDYDAENRGKTRCQLVAASMPILLTGDVNMEEYKAKVNELVEYIFTGK